MIDEIRKQIQERGDQLLAEADGLRRALAALAGGDRPAASPARRRTRTQTTDRSCATATGRRSTVSTESRSRSARRGSVVVQADHGVDPDVVEPRSGQRVPLANAPQ
jgi:hypothetical protein